MPVTQSSLGYLGMLPFLPEKHTLQLNNLLILALITQSSDGLVETIDTMPVVKGVLLFVKNPNETVFQTIFKVANNNTQWNAHALNFWISLLVLVDVTEGYQVYLKSKNWAAKKQIKHQT